LCLVPLSKGLQTPLVIEGDVRAEIALN
jgi:hypothetical protein